MGLGTPKDDVRNPVVRPKLELFPPLTHFSIVIMCRIVSNAQM